MTPDVAPKANLQWIQALRGLAALMVLFFGSVENRVGYRA